jgi:outer membrane beta-barrel protein
MGLRAAAVVVGMAALLVGTEGLAQEGFDPTAVRHRLYDMQGTLELQPFVGTQLFGRLTEHQMVGAAVAYNLFDSLALEVRAGYAFSRRSGLADQIEQQLIQRDPASGDLTMVDDLSDLWELRAHAVAGIRWAPIYGKLALFAETPLHFQSYLWLGGGVGLLHRQSVVYCQEVTSRLLGTCGVELDETRGAPVVSAALGLRIFAGSAGSALLELRSFVFKDRYRVDVDRSVAETGGETGTLAPSPGLTQVLMIDLGFSFGF